MPSDKHNLTVLSKRRIYSISSLHIFCTHFFKSSTATAAAAKSTSVACSALDATFTCSNNSLRNFSPNTKSKQRSDFSQPLDIASVCCSKNFRIADKHLSTILRFTHLAAHRVAVSDCSTFKQSSSHKSQSGSYILCDAWVSLQQQRRHCAKV